MPWSTESDSWLEDMMNHSVKAHTECKSEIQCRGIYEWPAGF